MGHTAKGFWLTMLGAAGVLVVVCVAAFAGCAVQHRPTWTVER